MPFKCQECGFVSFFGPVAAVGGLIVNELGELLLIRRAREPGKGKWGLPGGFVDPGESAEEAVEREIREEIGLTIKAMTYLCSSPNRYDYRGIIAPVIDFFYLCSANSDSELTIAEEELDHFEWSVPTSDHLENMAFESNRLAIEHWLNHVSD